MARNLAIIAVTSTLAVAAATLALAQSPRRPTAPIGVLVGLHHWIDIDSRPPSPGRFRTLWIHGVESVAQPVEVRDLLVPRRSGFWLVGLQGECREHEEVAFDDSVIGTVVIIADYLWARPVGKGPAPFSNRHVSQRTCIA